MGYDYTHYDEAYKANVTGVTIDGGSYDGTLTNIEAIGEASYPILGDKVYGFATGVRAYRYEVTLNAGETLFLDFDKIKVTTEAPGQGEAWIVAHTTKYEKSNEGRLVAFQDEGKAAEDSDLVVCSVGKDGDKTYLLKNSSDDVKTYYLSVTLTPSKVTNDIGTVWSEEEAKAKVPEFEQKMREEHQSAFTLDLTDIKKIDFENPTVDDKEIILNEEAGKSVLNSFYATFEWNEAEDNYLVYNYEWTATQGEVIISGSTFKTNLVLTSSNFSGFETNKEITFTVKAVDYAGLTVDYNKCSFIVTPSEGSKSYEWNPLTTQVEEIASFSLERSATISLGFDDLAQYKGNLYITDLAGKNVVSVAIKDGELTTDKSYVLDGGSYILRGKVSAPAGAANVTVAAEYFPEPKNQTEEDAREVDIVPGTGTSAEEAEKQVIEDGFVGKDSPAEYINVTPSQGAVFNVGLKLKDETAKIKATLYRKYTDAKGKVKEEKLASVNTAALLKGELDCNLLKETYLSSEEEYYIKVETTDKGKGKQNTAYEVYVENYNSTTIGYNSSKTNAVTAPQIVYTPYEILEKDQSNTLTDWVGRGNASDYISIAVDKVGKYIVALGGAEGVFEETDAKAKVTVFDSDTGKKVSNFTVKAGQCGEAEVWLGPNATGTAKNYVFAVETSGAKKATGTGYTLAITAAAEENIHANALVGNENIISATKTTIGSIGEGTYWLGQNNKVDYFAFTVSSIDDYIFTLTGKDGGAVDETVKVTVLKLDAEAKGNVAAKYKKVYSFSAKAGDTKSSDAWMGIDKGGEYLVKVESNGSKKRNGTDYNLSIRSSQTVPVGVPTILGNEKKENASVLANLEDQKGWVGFCNTADFYAFQGVTGVSMSLDIYQLGNEKVELYTVTEKNGKQSYKKVKFKDYSSFELDSDTKYVLGLSSKDKGKGVKNFTYALSFKSEEENFESAQLA